jgi:aminomethyltransferase
MKQVFPALPVDSLKYMHFTNGIFDGAELFIARTGYTGEDGFEIYCYNKDTVSIWSRLLEKGAPLGLIPCGLGCRDTLRLEMAYPLYGHELTDEINPLEANLAWVVKLEKGDFLGRSALLQQKEQGVKRKRVGFILIDRASPGPIILSV